MKKKKTHKITKGGTKLPFKSEAQRKYIYANKPNLAKKWSEKYENGGYVKKPTCYKDGGYVKSTTVSKTP